MTPDHMTPIQRARHVTGPHTKRRRFWINLAVTLAAVMAGAAAFAVGCG